MNERQFQQTVQNRRRYEVAPLFGNRELAGLLRSAGRADQQRAAAAQAWARVVPAKLLGSTVVTAFEHGTVVVAVGDSTTCYYLRQEVSSLRQRLTRVLPGARRLKFELQRERGDGRQESK